MAWSSHAWGRKERKEADPHLRSDLKRDAVAEPAVKTGSRKRPSCGSRKYGIEYKAKPGIKTWFDWASDWRHYYSWYETKKQRDQALEALIRKCQVYDYRAIER